ncbi:hypothetical protein BMJ22_10190 [Sinorhizobium medicae]|uniref:Uncharacterized protein n=1 Tax=Sinorhizobium medicae TaxID=110321 RepID=A0A508WX37_9HYPH|nr:hypothetical protein BMJ22_10190 [Sinorhizobium medicae]VTZ61806.1 hypothetical protein EMEDMD4_310055 [Sinorhizobium medicae]
MSVSPSRREAGSFVTFILVTVLPALPRLDWSGPFKAVDPPWPQRSSAPAFANYVSVRMEALCRRLIVGNSSRSEMW